MTRYGSKGDVPFGPPGNEAGAEERPPSPALSAPGAVGSDGAGCAKTGDQTRRLRASTSRRGKGYQDATETLHAVPLPAARMTESRPGRSIRPKRPVERRPPDAQAARDVRWTFAAFEHLARFADLRRRERSWRADVLAAAFGRRAFRRRCVHAARRARTVRRRRGRHTASCRRRSPCRCARSAIGPRRRVRAGDEVTPIRGRRPARRRGRGRGSRGRGRRAARGRPAPSGRFGPPAGSNRGHCCRSLRPGRGGVSSVRVSKRSSSASCRSSASMPLWLATSKRMTSSA